jgi:hypothetical protein
MIAIPFGLDGFSGICRRGMFNTSNSRNVRR